MNLHRSSCYKALGGLILAAKRNLPQFADVFLRPYLNKLNDLRMTDAKNQTADGTVKARQDFYLFQ